MGWICNEHGEGVGPDECTRCLHKRIAELEAQRATLRDAVKPFAAVRQAGHPEGGLLERNLIDDILPNDFRAAAAAMEATGGEGGELTQNSV